MSKYDPLRNYLAARSGRELRMSFADIEAVLGFSLPAASKRQRAWWSNNPSNNVMTRAWLAAGYKSAEVDMAGERLTFVPLAQMEGFAEMAQTGIAGAPGGPHPLFGAMKGTTKIAPGTDIAQPADPSWAQVYADSHAHAPVVATTPRKARD